MLPSWYFILFIFSLVTVQSLEITVKKHDSQVGPGNGSKVHLNGRMEYFDEGLDRVLQDYANNYQGDHFPDVLKFSPGTDEEGSDIDASEVSSEKDTNTIRALQTGDTFSPLELLPISTKLLAKVDGGGGKGIVSSSKSPEDLADRLFAAFFLTSRRIVHLADTDLSGLDALQALALDGEVVRTKASGDSITERPYQITNYRGQVIGLDEGPMRCHYKLISKRVNASDSALRKGSPPFKKVLKMEKLLNPKRQLIVNYKGRKSNNERIKFNKRGVDAKHSTAKEENVKMVDKEQERRRIRITRGKTSKEGNKKVIRHQKLKKHRLRKKENSTPLPITTTKKPACRWRYICRNPSDLDTCRLHSSCYSDSHNKPMIDNNEFVDPKEKIDHDQSLLALNFRKMLGITVIDEEVEKIIEKHILTTKPENMHTDDRIETIDEYFNNIIIAQHAQQTTPITKSEDHTQHPMAAVVASKELKHWIDSGEGLRQIGDRKAKEKSTPQPNVEETETTRSISKSTAAMKSSKHIKKYMM